MNILKKFTRRQIVCIEKALLILFSISFIFSGIFFFKGNSGKAYAGTSNHKYFTPVLVEPGDSLWSIADDYITEEYSSIDDYIDEVISINHLSGHGDINAGCYITVPYYAAAPVTNCQ